MPYVRKPKSSKSRKSIRSRKAMPKMSARAVSKVVKRYVKSAISRHAETKHCAPLANNNINILPYNSTTFQCTAIDLTNVLNTNQGTGQGDRIGSEIQVVKYTFKGFVNFAFSSAGGNKPCYLKMVIGRLKESVLAPARFDNLFQNGNTTAAPGNLPTDMLRKFNKDAWIIYTTRMFKLGNSSDTIVAGVNNNNNDFSLCRMFSIDLSKHVQRIKYNDSTSDPTNVGVYAWFLLCNADGSPITTTVYPTTEIHYDVEASFKDS